MTLSPRHWRARHLLAAWIAYWALLLGAVLAPAALALWRIRGAPENTSNAAFSFGDQGLEAHVTAHGATVWSGAVGGWTALAWLVGPPLLIWLLWLALRPRHHVAAPLDDATTREARALPPSAPPFDDSPVRDRDPLRERR